MKALGKIVLNSILGFILIFIWLKFVDIQQIISTISRVKIASLLPVLVFMLASPVIRAIRLKVFLKEIKNIPLLALIFLNGVAIMLNFFIPIRAGEIAKGIYLNTHFGLPLGKSVIWVFLDRFVDFMVILILAAILLFIIPTSLNITFIIVIIIILTLASLLSYLAIFKQTFARKIVNFLRSILIEKHIKIYFDRFSNFILDSFSILKRHPRDLLLMAVLTVLAYGADAFIWQLTFTSLGVNQQYFKMYLGQLLSALTYLIPAAPGYVGSAEASGLLILSGIFGLNTNLASAMIVLFHLLSAIFVLVFGLISIFSLKLDLKLTFRKALKRED